MGAWGAGNFENDMALDWVIDLEASNDLGLVENAIAEVLNSGEYLDADAGCAGLAAAEVVAALKGSPMAGLPEDVSAWVGAHPGAPGEELIKDCLAAVDKIRDSEASELSELWHEDDEPPVEWYAALDGLVARLRK
jgi:hypothetical protein